MSTDTTPPTAPDAQESGAQPGIIRPEQFMIDDGASGGERGKQWRAVFILQGCAGSPTITVCGATADDALEKARDRAPADCVRIRIFSLTKVADAEGPFVKNLRCLPKHRNSEPDSHAVEG